MTNQRETDMRKELVRQLCTQSNRVFRLELCVARYLEQKGHSKEIVKAALAETRLGNLDQLTEIFNA